MQKYFRISDLVEKKIKNRNICNYKQKFPTTFNYTTPQISPTFLNLNYFSSFKENQVNK